MSCSEFSIIKIFLVEPSHNLKVLVRFGLNVP